MGTTEDDLWRRQLKREQRQRDAATGRRLKAIQSGQYGPVLKRWVGATIQPTAERIRLAAAEYLDRDYSAFASLLDSPLFELSATAHGATSDLAPILQWCCKGSSPGREGDTTFADDLVLTILGSTLLLLCERQNDVTLTHALVAAGEAAREAVIGQWLTTIQGPETLESIRKHNKASWQQAKKLQYTTGLMLGEIKTVLDQAARGEINLEAVGSRRILEVFQGKGRGRRISLRTPEVADWAVLRLAFKPKGELDHSREAWVAFALMVLCAAQMEVGWFDISSKGSKGTHQRRAPHRLIFSDEAFKVIGRDIDRWLELGFALEPMLVKPEKGDYLSVKHLAVTGRRGPMGKRTDGDETQHWKTACEVLAGTAWSVNEHLLGGDIGELSLRACEGDEAKCVSILAAHKREAAREFYLPIYMDFRGRLYPRTSFVTYQGNDLQKALLCFPQEGAEPYRGKSFSNGQAVTNCAIALHLSNLYGNGLDKAPLSERLAWMDKIEDEVRAGKLLPFSNLVLDADEPLQFLSGIELLRHGQWNRIPIQQDGTCNGLQHLSAMFADEEAAPFVNLTARTFEDPKADIYQVVADTLMARLESLWRTNSGMSRLVKSDVVFDRKLVKKPVMVLPYGGTLGTIEEVLFDGIIAQKPNARMWVECLKMDSAAGLCQDTLAINAGYLAFADRPLEQHPLFKADVRALAMVLWDCIRETIPKAVLAMEALRKLGKHIKQDSLTWDCNFGYPPLRVVHAYPKSSSNTLKLKGLHLGGEVRAMKINSGRDEVDPYKHVTGIVANFIHSQDATHLARTMNYFDTQGGGSFGAVHDCFMCRATDWEAMRNSTRGAFVAQYGRKSDIRHPLECQVELQDLQTGTLRKFPSWLDMAQAFGVEFPKFGQFDVKQVLESAWFFS